ncbi:MAG TPA: hypothetical protein VF818_07700 [Ktedonobacterales bacterium]
MLSTRRLVASRPLFSALLVRLALPARLGATASLLVNPALRALDQTGASREPVPVEV